MPTVEDINAWIQGNVLDTKSWEDASRKEVALVQAERNLKRWYPNAELTNEIISYQVIWELQGLDPVLKYGKQGIKAISEGQDRIDYLERDKVAPEVREILGVPLYELEEIESPVILEGGILL
ncbi:hypothetical protein OEV98_10995 [Caldibacillus lycopersici]|uniref:Uncharacterized protein n=1 Tax=Perspicuibacillus lycopersici TaxID=1325689 RepID=A0AAE3ITB9_9BACI|nr:hypothetical protein [Perspicuibacillus lycopersici]MCU9614086.1 hypothetical protein [Perspicuibacillus lycopersici]